MKRLSPDQLVRHCDPDALPFETTAELPAAADFFGQSRAADAVRFAIEMRREGYNLYVMGPAGIGKQSLVRHCLETAIPGRSAPADWCYVMNFADARKPRALCLPPGRGTDLRRDMRALVDELGTAIPAVFESDAYRARRGEIERACAERERAAFGALGEEARRHGIVLVRNPGGFTLAPMQNGEAGDPDAFEKPSDAENSRTGGRIAELQERLHRILHERPQWEKERRERMRELDREVTRDAVGLPMAELKARYPDLPAVMAYFDEAAADVVENVDLFRRTEQPAPLPVTWAVPDRTPRRYHVNLLVDHARSEGPPVVCADPCTLAELVGRIEHVAHLGALATDFTLIRAGALHRANGGYLLLDAVDVLSHPFAWEALKRCLSSGEIRIDSAAEHFSPVAMASIEPEPLPLDVKVILFGERMLYYLLHEYDPEFHELFKVQADFADRLPRSPEGVDFYARFAATVARRDGLLPLHGSAVARLIDHGARLGEDSEKLSAQLQNLADLLRETDFWARKAAKSVADRGDVQRAIDAREARADRLREEVHEAILRDILFIDSAGASVGQVNGLSVLRLADFEFAEPTRITATVRIGEGDVVDIQREVDMGGALHSKGVMILSSFLAARFAKTAPLSLAASLVFEQTYEPVEGDSASLAELCALLSALADAPIRQSLAVTGSVDQHGRVQAIGAVNEKIEGFFDICSRRGLTGTQGVLIPASNLPHLMLREDVVAAVRDGQFSVYAVGTVDEAIELLTGIPAGAPDARGLLATGGINARVQARVHEFSLIRREYVRRGRRRFAPGHD